MFIYVFTMNGSNAYCFRFQKGDNVKKFREEVSVLVSIVTHYIRDNNMHII